MAQVNNMHNLTTLIKRLEAATSRLEDIASSTIEIPQAVPGIQETLASPIATTSSKDIPDVPAPATAPAAALQEPLPEYIEDFDAFIQTEVDNYVKLSAQIGGAIAQQANLVKEGFAEERTFLLLTSKAKKPNLSAESDLEAYQALLKPINDRLMAVVEIKESNRGSPFMNHINSVAEGIMMLAWVTNDTKPHKLVEELLGSAQYYANRVLKDAKDKDPQQVEWIRSYLRIFTDLTEYIKQYFPSGITWNAKGLSLPDVLKSQSPSSSAGAPPPPPPPAGGLPPPPPPPGPPPVLKINEEKPAPAKAAGGLDAVFSELNKGEAVTKGLRKVDRSEMTHKNPSLRASSTVPDSDARAKSPAPGKKPKPESMRVKKPPVKVLEGNKWTIENFEKEAAPIEIEASLTQSVLISRCSNTTIIIRGKANAVAVDNTKRVNVVVDTLVSSVDVVKSQNFALQVMGTIPTVMADSVDGAQIYLSKESTSTKIIHSKSAGINLNVIAGPDDDYIEVPLPGQISSYYDVEKKALVDEIVSHAG